MQIDALIQVRDDNCAMNTKNTIVGGDDGLVGTGMSESIEPAFTVHDEPLQQEIGIVDAGLGRSNDAAAPLHDVRHLSCFARLPDGSVIGGAIGRTWGSCCELQQLWVADAHRRKGVGTRLIKEFERVGEARGCRTFYLETFSFQAPALYRSLGYEVKVQLRGFPAGIVKFIMVREVT